MPQTVTFSDARELLNAHFEDAPISAEAIAALDAIVEDNETKDFYRGLFYGMILSHNALCDVDNMEDIYRAMQSFRQVCARAANHIVD